MIIKVIKILKKSKRKENSRIRSLENDVNSVKNDLSEIKSSIKEFGKWK